MEFHVEYRHKSYMFLKKENIGGYTCLVTRIECTNPDSTIIKIIGQHQGLENNEDVIGFSIRKSPNLKMFPREVGKIFPNLKYFEIDNSSITTLTREDLLNFGHLQGLWMPKNHIVSLDSDLFVNVQGLRFLSFRQNKLKYVGANILTPLLNLQSANFCENTTIDKSFNDGDEELAEMNKEIAIKCAFPAESETLTAPNMVVDLQKRVDLLELKIRKLESEKEMQSAKLAQVSALSTMVEILQARMDVFENLLQ